MDCEDAHAGAVERHRVGPALIVGFGDDDPGVIVNTVGCERGIVGRGWGSAGYVE